MIIYKTTCLINNKIYIGQTQKMNEDYLGSGVKITDAIKKFGKSNFKRETLRICKNQKELDAFERYFIKKFDSTNIEIGYNILPGTANGFGHVNPSKIKSVRDKISNTVKQHHADNPDQARNHSKFMMGNKNNKLGEQHHNFGKPWSEEAKLKLSNSLKGRTSHNKGKPCSEETKRKISKSLKGRLIGINNPNRK